MIDEELREKYGLVREAINNKYRIESLLSDYIKGINPFMTICKSIFTSHDNTPSMRIDLQNNRWNDFSSGFKGGYLELKWRIAKELNGETVSIYEMANKILTSDKEIQQRLGLTSLFKKNKCINEPFVFNSGKPTRVSTETLDVILKRLRKNSNRTLLYKLISDLQMGMSEQEVVRYYGDLSKVSSANKVSVSEEIRKILEGS